MSTSVVDTIFDLAESGLAAFDQMASQMASQGPDGSEVADPEAASPVPPRAWTRSPARPALPPGRITSRSRFRVEDVVDGETGRPIYVVTDGRERAECSSRAFAERVRAALV